MKRDEIKLAVIAFVGFVILVGLLALCAGCHTALQVTLTDATAVDLGNVTFSDTQWPLVSYFSGPRWNLRVTKEYKGGTLTINGSASLTNNTHILGMYDGYEAKELRINASFTNDYGSASRCDGNNGNAQYKNIEQGSCVYPEYNTWWREK